MACTITLQELHDFHSIDRQLYVRLVLGLRLDFNLSLQVVAFWYWLETKGYKYFIKIVLQLPNQWLYGLAMEAKICLYSLAVGQSLEYFFDLDLNFPFMRCLVDRDFSIVELCKDREKTLNLIEGYLKNLFGRVFNDLIPINLLPNGFQGQPVLVNGFPVQSSVASNVHVPIVLANGVEVPAMMASAVQPQPMAPVQAFVANGVQVLPVAANGVQVQDTVTNGAQVPPLVANGANVQTLAANEAKVPCLVANGGQVPPVMANGGQLPPVLANGIQVPTTVANGVPVCHNARNLQMVTGKDENGTHVGPNGSQNLLSVSEHDRTLFITFSKGHSSISKPELNDLITRNFGNCVESIHMRVEPPPLFALVVVKSASALTKILGEKDLVKLSTNGKDVWLRRFLPKQDDNHL